MEEYQTECGGVGNYIDSLLKHHPGDITLKVRKKGNIKSVSVVKGSRKKVEEHCALCDEIYPINELKEIKNEPICPYCEPKVKHILGIE